jgi:hypothetical protein
LKKLPRPLALILSLSVLSLLALFPGAGRATIDDTGPPLSDTALFSRFAREHGLAPPLSPSPGLVEEPPTAEPSGGLQGPEIRLNQDQSRASQNETTVAINPSSPNMIIAGANDYRLGVPVGAAFYTSFDGGATWRDGFPPFPLLAGPPEPQDDLANGASDERRGPGSYFVSKPQFTEPPSGTGDPVIAFGEARPGSPDLLEGSSVAYYAYLGVSASFCEHGLFVSRSTNGLTWTRPAVPTLLPRKGLFTPVYWEQIDDCGVFNDKPWIAVDRSGGPHNGRVYIVWARFEYDDGQFQQSTIEMSYSDDNAETWSRPINVSGFSPSLCPAQVRGRAGHCDESQFATAVVAPDGTLYVAFINQQAQGLDDGLRNQYLFTAVDPDTFQKAGPYRAASMIDGRFDFPVNGLGQATLCNSNFRMNTAGNLAIDPSDPTGRTLYIVFADNRNGSEFPDRPMVSQDPPDSFVCPEGKTTDTDIFIVRSTNGGVTWSDPRRVNQDGPGKDQWFPFAAVSTDGHISVVFNDRRDDFANRLMNVYVATSVDGGTEWSETRVTSVASNINWAFEQGFFIGDYNGLAIAPDGTKYPVWTDARNGTPFVRESDVYIGILPP